MSAVALIRIWFPRLWRADARLMVLIVALSTVYAATTAAFPWLWQYLVDGVRGDDPAQIDELGLWMLGVGLAQYAVNLALQGARTVANGRLQWRARVAVWDHLSELPDAPWTPGDRVTRLTDDVGEKTTWFLCSAIFRALMAGLIALSCLAMMAAIDPTLAAWVALPLPILLGAQALIQGTLTRRDREVQAAISGINDQLATLFEGIRILQAAGLEGLARARFREQLARQERAEIRTTDVRQMVFLLYGHGWQIAMVALLLAGGAEVMAGELTLGQFTTFEGLVMTMIWPMFDLGMLVSRIPQAGVSLGRLQAVLDRPLPAVSEGTAPAHGGLSLRGASATAPRVASDPDAGQIPLLSGVDLDLQPGQRLAIVGEVGSGKSTLLRLLSGASPLADGALSIGGQPIDGPFPRRVRDAVAWVPQDPVLISASLEENILLGRELPRADLDWALAVSRLAQDLPQLPDGLATKVGERGVTLSGGQQQRVALARALAGRPRILLLDDATAALDADTERAFWQGLTAELPDVTAAVVTHRVATIERADQILVLADGRVAQRGDHAALIAADGPYRKIYGRMQARSKLEG